MEVTSSSENGITFLHLNGRLDATTANQLDQTIREIFTGGAKRLVVDLTKLSYISSAGLRVFLSAAKQTKSVEGKLALFGLSEEVKQIFDISGFSSILPVFPSQSDAVAAV
jgi:anti-anti-sigma factor